MPAVSHLCCNPLYLVLAGVVVAAAIEVEDPETCGPDPQPATGSVLLQRQHTLSDFPGHDRSPREFKGRHGNGFQDRRVAGGAAEPQSMFDWLWGSLEEGEHRAPDSAANIELSQRANKTKGVVTVKLQAMSRTPLNLLQDGRPPSKTATAKGKSAEQDASGAGVAKQKLLAHGAEDRAAPAVRQAKVKPIAHASKDNAAVAKKSVKSGAAAPISEKLAEDLNEDDAAESTSAGKENLKVHAVKKKSAAVPVSPKPKLHPQPAKGVTVADGEVETDEHAVDVKPSRPAKASKEEPYPVILNKLAEAYVPAEAVALKEKNTRKLTSARTADKAVNMKAKGAEKLETAMKDGDEDNTRDRKAFKQKKGVDSRRKKQQENSDYDKGRTVHPRSSEESAPKASTVTDVPELELLEEINGDSAPLTEEGYQTLAETMDPGEMETFVRRVCDKLSLKVIDSQGLRELVPRYDGERETQNYGALEAELQRLQGQEDSWLEVDLRSEDGSPVHGSNAPLSKVGYFAVAKLKSQEEMTEFTRRLVSDMGFNIINEGMLGGLVEWYSGEKVTQSFDALQSEIGRISKKQDTWIVRS